MPEHKLDREYAGRMEGASITPFCSCGWVGIAEFAYNDYQHSRVQDQENRHVQNHQAVTQENRPV